MGRTEHELTSKQNLVIIIIDLPIVPVSLIKVPFDLTSSPGAEINKCLKLVQLLVSQIG